MELISVARHADDRTVAHEQDLDLCAVSAPLPDHLHQGRDIPLIDRRIDKPLRAAQAARGLGVRHMPVGQLDRA